MVDAELFFQNTIYRKRHIVPVLFNEALAWESFQRKKLRQLVTTQKNVDKVPHLLKYVKLQPPGPFQTK